MSLKKRESIGLVVVTYHPPLDFYYYLSILSVQAKHIVIVDNTPTQECPDVLEKCNCLDNIEIIRNKMNFGIARALNQGIRRARLLGHEWVVTFDQDTRVDADFFVNIYKAYLVLDGHTTHPIAVMGANYTDMTSGAQPHQYPVAAGEAILVAAVITSGSLISTWVHEKIGGFDEKYFVDMVDFEYCVHARQLGYSVYRTNKPLMVQSIGDAEQKRLFGFVFNVTNHMPQRRYYIFRNSINMAKRYLFFDPCWCLHILFSYLPKVCIKACLFENRKKENLHYILMGSLDGLCSRFSRKVL